MPRIGKDKIIFKELSYKICGACFETHNILGRFKNERQYADVLEQFFKAENIKYKREFIIPTSFEGEQKGRNRVNFLIEEAILLDIKAKTLITKEDYFQMQRYLSSASKRLGIIVNFRQKYLSPKRVLN